MRIIWSPNYVSVLCHRDWHVLCVLTRWFFFPWSCVGPGSVLLVGRWQVPLPDYRRPRSHFGRQIRHAGTESHSLPIYSQVSSINCKFHDERTENVYAQDPDELNDKGMPLTARVVYVIGPDHKVKALIVYPATSGRNFKYDAKSLSWNGPWVETGAFPWRVEGDKLCLRFSNGRTFGPCGLPLFQLTDLAL